MATAFPPASPLGLFSNAWINRKLILRLTRRQIESRYRGSYLGLLWSVLIPLALLGVYTFVFSAVFEARWEQSVSDKGHFALLLFVGLIIFNIFAECVGQAPSLLLSHVSYIKKVVFPLEILPWVSLLSSLFNGLIGLLVFGAGYAVLLGTPPWTAVLLPLFLIPLSLVSLGCCLFLASMGVFVRDLQPFIGVLMMMLMFLSPLFYPVSAIPQEFQMWIRLSPLTAVIEAARDVVFWGRVPSPDVWFLYFVGSWMIAWFGQWWFLKTRKGFADVV